MTGRGSLLKNRWVPMLFLGSTLLLALPSQIFGNGGGVESVISRLNSMTSFRASVSMEFGSNGGRMSGVLSYQNGKIHLEMGDGRVIASNGRHLIVYNPASGVAGKQELSPEKSGGPGWLHGMDVTESRAGWAHLAARSPGAYIREVELKWDETNLLKEIKIRNKTGPDWLIIRLSNVRVVKSFPPTLFSWKPPPGSRTVENALNQSN